MWALVTQPYLRLAAVGAVEDGSDTASSNGSSGHGVLVAQTVEACSVVLRNVVCPVVAGDSSAAKEDVQAALESIYRAHVVGRLPEACRVYGASLSEKCISAVVAALSELVLSSSKYLAQVCIIQICSKYMLENKGVLI